MESELKDIVWGNKLFVNAQFVIGLANRISKFLDGELRIDSVFDYVNAVKKQKIIELYKDLDREVEEILFLENEIKEGSASIEDKDLINFVLGSTITIFTSKITRKG